MELRSFHELPSLAAPPAKPEPPATGRAWLKGIAAGIKALRPGRELVAGGDVLWKPINKQAAMLLAKSPEIFKPQNTMSQTTTFEKFNNGEVDKVIVKNATEAEQIAGIGRKFIKSAKETPRSAIEFAEEVARAREILYQATDAFRADVGEFTLNDMPKSLEKVRAWRMTIEREVSMSLRALEDLRKFFLGDAHEKEMLRLNDFVRTCERLSALAKDGTLDKVADVMLKLA